LAPQDRNSARSRCLPVLAIAPHTCRVPKRAETTTGNSKSHAYGYDLRSESQAQSNHALVPSSSFYRSCRHYCALPPIQIGEKYSRQDRRQRWWGLILRAGECLRALLSSAKAHERLLPLSTTEAGRRPTPHSRKPTRCGRSTTCHFLQRNGS